MNLAIAIAQLAYSFKDAVYKPGAFYTAATPGKTNIAWPLEIVVYDSGKFTARVPDVFSKYKLPDVSSNHVVDLWSSQPMGFFQNQVNFAVWCASTGCGVSAAHLSGTEPLIRSVYTFHVYYQVRRILAELRAPLPDEATWNVYENSYDRKAYERICSEFRVDPHTDWRRKGLPNHGLGKVYTNGHPEGDGEYYPTPVFGWTGRGGTDIWHDESATSGYIKESLTEPTSFNTPQADYIAQVDRDASAAWTTFILDKGEGFTQAGVVHLNDSIWTYVWAILGAQAQTRTIILGSGTASDAQKQWLVLVEDSVSSPVDLPSSIQRYRDTLQEASSKLDYVFGRGLYLAPSDMRLRIGRIEGYNNEIQIATADIKLGSNTHVNDTPVPSPALPIREPMSAHYEPPPYVPATPAATTTAAEVVAANQHQDEKIALVIGIVAIGLCIIWWRSR